MMYIFLEYTHTHRHYSAQVRVVLGCATWPRPANGKIMQMRWQTGHSCASLYEGLEDVTVFFSGVWRTPLAMSFHVLLLMLFVSMVLCTCTCCCLCSYITTQKFYDHFILVLLSQAHTNNGHYVLAWCNYFRIE